MGMPLPGKPEISENAVSEGHDRPQRTSIDSPKAAQPCLRGGLIRLFLKRTEQNMSPEHATSSIQSTEDKREVRGKKRKVLSGNIFRLPCLRPADKTDTSEQINAQVNKVDDQGNQATPEEELKPYSKASFLRKIRGYRLMRERDATEREKVIEMEQCKEGSVAEEHHGRESQLGENVAEPRSCEDKLGQKGKVSREKRSQGNTRGEKSSKTLELEGKAGSSTYQGDGFKKKNNDKNLREKTSDETDNCGMDVGVKRNDVAERKNLAENVEELGNDLQEHAGRAKGQKEEDILDQECHKETVEDLGSKVTKQVEQTTGVLENSMSNQEINSQRGHELETDFSQHNQHCHTKEAGDVAKDLPENELKLEKAEKLINHLQERPEENTGDMAKSSPKQHSNERRLKSEYSEQKKEGEVIQVIIGQMGHAEIAKESQKEKDKLEKSVGELPENTRQTNRLLDKKNKKENEDHLLEQGNRAENIGESDNYSQKQNIQREKVGEAMDHFVKQDSHVRKEEVVKDCSLEEDSHIQQERKTGEDSLHQDNDKKIEGKAMDHFLKQQSQIKKKEKAGNDLQEQDSHTEQKGRNHLLEDGSHTQKGGKADDQFLEEEKTMQKEIKVRHQFLEEDSHIEKEGKADDRFLEEDNTIQKEIKAADQLLEEDIHIQKEGKATDQFLEEDNTIQKDIKAGNQLLEEDSHIQKERKAVDKFLEEDNHIQKRGKAGDQFLEEDNCIPKERNGENKFLGQNSHLAKDGKAGERFIEEERHMQKDVRGCSQAQKTNTENLEEPEALCLNQKNKLGKTKAHIVAQNILAKEKGEGHLLEQNKRVKHCKGLGKVFTEEVKDKTVKQEIRVPHTTSITRSEEHHTEFSTLHKQGSAANTVDFNYYHQEGSQEDINDSDDDDDDDLMEDTEWRSLQVEVKGMVQWLVEEASDRLTCFTQESQGTE